VEPDFEFAPHLPAVELAESVELTVDSLEDFVAVDEPGADALLGDADGALIPEDGDVMMYGDGGAGKTTLAVDLAFHLAAGDEWLGTRVARPARVLLVENEGPRPLFRAKLRRKLDAWDGSPVDDRIAVVSAPWARLSFDSDVCRVELAAAIDELEVDVVIVGPVTRSGMNEAGTLQEVRDFMALAGDVRFRARRRVAFVLIHHENKGGQVSGAWEGAVDTLFHVQGQGHGKTRLFVQKARWSSSHHGTAQVLQWAPGDGFEVDDRPEVTEDTIADGILAAVVELPGGSWSKIRANVTGNAELAAEVRDRLLAAGRIVNTSTREGYFNLWLSDDPAVPADTPVPPFRSVPRSLIGGNGGTARFGAPVRGERNGPVPGPVPGSERVRLDGRPDGLFDDSEAA
jgi:hypothetical protein